MVIEHPSPRTVNQSDDNENDRDADCLSPVSYGAAPPYCERTVLRLVYERVVRLTVCGRNVPSYYWRSTDREGPNAHADRVGKDSSRSVGWF